MDRMWYYDRFEVHRNSLHPWQKGTTCATRLNTKWVFSMKCLNTNIPLIVSRIWNKHFLRHNRSSYPFNGHQPTRRGKMTAVWCTRRFHLKTSSPSFDSKCEAYTFLCVSRICIAMLDSGDRCKFYGGPWIWFDEFFVRVSCGVKGLSFERWMIFCFVWFLGRYASGLDDFFKILYYLNFWITCTGSKTVHYCFFVRSI